MRYIIIIAMLSGVGIGILFSCNKYKDAPPKNDPRLTNPYCNDPLAVNFNVGFPGKPDNTMCFYPTDLFKGVYLFKDTVQRDTLFISADSFFITIDRLSKLKISVAGFCSSGDTLLMTAGPTYVATVDTTEGDTTTVNPGQRFCRVQDTVTGTISRDRVDTTLLHISLQVVSDTGITTHTGSARLKK
jgi:hypothetical protein